MSHSGIKKSENACQRNLLKLCTWLDVSRRKYDSRFSNERVSFCVSYERGRCKAKFWRERVREGTIFFHVCVRESHTRASDDCIIPVVNAISRGEFDEFTTRFYEGTKRTDGRTFRDRPPPRRPAILDLCPTLPLPTDLHPDIYYSQYYRARLYCVSRKASDAAREQPRLAFFSSPPFLRFEVVLAARGASGPRFRCHLSRRLPFVLFNGASVSRKSHPL